MGNILVVDDEPAYCDEIATSLRRDSHVVQTALNHNDAIQQACNSPPDVLITDWLIRGGSNGLELKRVLQCLNAKMRTVLMTGYGSFDLRKAALSSQVVRFVDKPFELNELRTVVRDALQIDVSPARIGKIGVIHADVSGKILWINESGKRIISRAGLLGIASRIEQLFNVTTLQVISRAKADWVEIQPAANEQIIWFIRAGRIISGDTLLWLVVEDRAAFYTEAPVIYRLLGASESGVALNGHVLVIDDYEMVRGVAKEILENLHCVCHTAYNHREGLRLFKSDPQVKYVLIDYEMPEGVPLRLLSEMRGIRPDTKFIGISGGAHREHFAKLGVSDYLEKPWPPDRLVQLLTRLRDEQLPSGF